MSSDSELTDHSEDEYEVDATQPDAKKRKPKPPTDYTIKDALKQPTTASYATDWLAKQMKAGDIKVDPEYQRSVVWSDTKQTKLIDSILRNFYVPPILFCITEALDGDQTRICIDGKQRLTSIRRFLDGLIPHKDGKMTFYFKQVDPTKTVRLLPEPLRKQFRNKTLVCIEYRELSPVHEREMFQRVQLGMALTTGEQLQSFDGPMAKFVHDLHTKLFDKAQIGQSMNLAIDRGRGFQNLVQAIACISRLPDYSHATYTQQTKLLQCQSMDDEKVREVRAKSERTFNLLKEIASNPELCQTAFSLPGRATRNSPVEFCFSNILIAMRMDEPGIGPKQLAEAIGAMRAAMRAIHVDLRSNNHVSQSFWNYLNGRHQELPQPGPSTQGAAGSTTPASKRARIPAPLTPQTPTAIRAPKASLESTAAPKSDSSSRFYATLGAGSSQSTQYNWSSGSQ